jgi:hypothetical protein
MVHSAQPAVTDPALDPLAVDTGGKQLSPRDSAVLPVGLPNRRGE